MSVFEAVVPLGATGLTVSPLGLGCMVMSHLYGHADERESLATLDLALELGINFLDTADKYAGGANEVLLGETLGARREHVVLATKFGLVDSAGADLLVDTSAANVRRSCEASLRRLRTDHIDLYYAHRIDPAVPVEETVGAMGELVAAGLVRGIGLCEVSAAQLRRAHATHPVSAVQSEWSLFWRGIEDEVLPVARQLGVLVVPYSPLGRGFLAGAVTSREALGSGDFRSGDPRLSEANLERNRAALLAPLERLALDRGVTTAQLALAWLHAQGDDVVPIPGTERREYLRMNVDALAIRLGSEELAELDRVFAPGEVRGHRPQTGVRTYRPPA